MWLILIKLANWPLLPEQGEKFFYKERFYFRNFKAFFSEKMIFHATFFSDE